MTCRRTFDRRLAVPGGLAACFDCTDNGSFCANVAQAQLMIQVGGFF